jgi:hypothetical protein
LMNYFWKYLLFAFPTIILLEIWNFKISRKDF